MASLGTFSGGRVDEIRLDSDENGWELVIDTDNGTIRFNIHGMASSGDLDRDLNKALREVQEWREEGRAEALIHQAELARQETDDAYDRMVGDA